MEIKQGTNKFYVGNSENDFEAEITYQNLDGKTLVVDHTFVGLHYEDKVLLEN